MSTSWKIEGEYFESCNCTLLCPCLLSGAKARPTEGHCDVVIAFQVRSGSFDATDLAGLSAAIAVYAPGPMVQGNWTVVPYVDQKGAQAQRDALAAIFTGTAGGPLGLMAPLISTRKPARAVPIEFKVSGAKRTIVIPGVTDIEVEGIPGAGGAQVWFDNVGHFASRRLAAATAPRSHFKDQGFDFDNSGRNAHFSPIDWSGSA